MGGRCGFDGVSYSSGGGGGFYGGQAAGYRRTLFKLVVEGPRIYPVIRDA